MIERPSFRTTYMYLHRLSALEIHMYIFAFVIRTMCNQRVAKSAKWVSTAQSCDC
ncbi:hypothetical protein X777_02967 [Ooceraea biroi]|uniref:Uncharacterized protein n=1 Tax=Ooceraea biroi TaxID=2015173 RepID=A0A026WK51_OOCBI|nr:hypothetical protein X777_02967 [Ooceraea biroi]